MVEQTIINSLLDTVCVIYELLETRIFYNFVFVNNCLFLFSVVIEIGFGCEE